MDRPFTIYFDTNFFVWLAKATDEEAKKVISNLNLLKVRYVLSGNILFELLSGKGKEEQNRILVERLKGFEIEPYKVSIGFYDDADAETNLTWNALLLKGENRNILADFLKTVYDTETIAQSWSQLVDKQLNNNEEAKVQENLEPFLTSIGSNKELSNEENANAFANFASNLISNLSHLLPEEQRNKLEEIDFSVQKNPESLLNISNQLRDALGKETTEKLEEEKKITTSSVKLDPRPYKVAVNEASNKEIKNLGNTFRDAGHISVFVAHKDQIDLIQIDSHQKNLIERNKPKHRLIELDLGHRYFSVNALSDVIKIVTEKRQEIFN